METQQDYNEELEKYKEEFLQLERMVERLKDNVKDKENII